MVVLMDGKLEDMAEIVNCLPNRRPVQTRLVIVEARDDDRVIHIRLQPHGNERAEIGLRAIVVFSDDREVGPQSLSCS